MVAKTAQTNKRDEQMKQSWAKWHTDTGIIPYPSIAFVRGFNEAWAIQQERLDKLENAGRIAPASDRGEVDV